MAKLEEHTPYILLGAILAMFAMNHTMNSNSDDSATTQYILPAAKLLLLIGFLLIFLNAYKLQSEPKPLATPAESFCLLLSAIANYSKTHIRNDYTVYLSPASAAFACASLVCAVQNLRGRQVASNRRENTVPQESPDSPLLDTETDAANDKRNILQKYSVLSTLCLLISKLCLLPNQQTSTAKAISDLTMLISGLSMLCIGYKGLYAAGKRQTEAAAAAAAEAAVAAETNSSLAA